MQEHLHSAGMTGEKSDTAFRCRIGDWNVCYR